VAVGKKLYLQTPFGVPAVFLNNVINTVVVVTIIIIKKTILLLQTNFQKHSGVLEELRIPLYSLFSLFV
jgi:uncharacterized protein YhhL (DUF1145 family)